MALPFDTPAASEPPAPEDTASRVHRIVYRRGAHEWRFAFTDADAPTLTARLDQLAQDPDAALDALDVSALRARIARLHDSPAPPSTHSPSVHDLTA